VAPWVGAELSGLVEFPAFKVPPGTRRGVVPDAAAAGSTPAPTGGADARLRPLLLDFGLALRGESEAALTVDGQILGTPAYMRYYAGGQSAVFRSESLMLSSYV